MKKNYFSSLKLALVAMLSLVSLAANAGAASNKWYYVAAKAYPSGSGTVYVTSSQTDPGEEGREYKDVCETQFHDDSGIYSAFNFYAKPAEGLKFIGWAPEITDAEGNTKVGAIETNDNPASISIDAKTDTGEDDGSTGIEPWPLFPDSTYYAIFGLVDYKYSPGQGGYHALGYVDIENPAAKVGEKATFTATPRDSTCTFVKWVDANGKEYKQNPVTITVDGPNTMMPVFSCINYKHFNFPTDGAILITHMEREIYIGQAHEDGVAMAFGLYNESWQKDTLGVRTNNYITNNPDDNGYRYQRRRNEGFLLWGKGEFDVELDDYENCMADTANYCKYDYVGYKIEDQPQDGTKYYVLADDHRFHQVTEGYIDEERWALAVPDSVGETSPVIDLILEAAGETAEKRFPIVNPFNLKDFKVVEDPTAISSVSAEEPKTMKQLYDLGGRIVTAPRKGNVIITDGKKKLIK